MWTLPSAGGDLYPVKYIVIVEDDAILGPLLVEAIQDEMAYQVCLASSGEMALSIVQTLVPKLFVLDYHLPGMNGLQLVDQLQSREGGEHIPILLMSAALPQGDLGRYHLRTLQKPFDLETLLQLLTELLLSTNHDSLSDRDE
jgi:CheY-like chemotaxis protein